MSKNLVIVESPAKAKTIKKYLGSDYEVLASYGHVRDLVPKEGAVDTEHGFEMRYQLIDKNKKHVEEIAKAVKRADAIYLATDPDREGEAISWHVRELLAKKKALPAKVDRVTFNAITKGAVTEAMKSPRDLDQPLIDAYLARHVFGPLGMTSTMYRPDPSLHDRVAPTEFDPWRQRHIRGEVHDENAFMLGGVSTTSSSTAGGNISVSSLPSMISAWMPSDRRLTPACFSAAKFPASTEDGLASSVISASGAISVNRRSV